jgi:hypothetical protein
MYDGLEVCRSSILKEFGGRERIDLIRYANTIQGDSMKNDEYIIYICNSKGSMLQSYRKIGDTWTQTIHSNGTVRTMTAEQLLSHILPPLAGISPSTVKVVMLPSEARKNTDTNNARAVIGRLCDTCDT